MSAYSQYRKFEILEIDIFQCLLSLLIDTWRNYVTAAGFFEVQCYFRPPGLPCYKQPWLVTVWRKG